MGKIKKWLSRDREGGFYDLFIQPKKPTPSQHGIYPQGVISLTTIQFQELRTGVALRPGECEEIKNIIFEME